MGDSSSLLRQWYLLRTIAQDNGAATVKSLAAVAAVSEKTIRRDLATLVQVGFPVEERSGEFGRKTFAIAAVAVPQLQFTYDEALALSLCRRAVSGFGGTLVEQSLDAAFRKIGSSLGRRVERYVQTMLGRITQTQLGADYGHKAEILDQLFIGIEEHRAVFLTYQSQRATEAVTYDVYPYRIIDHRGSLYLFGHSPDHGELRTWKLDRMLAAELTEIRFRCPDEAQLNDQLAGSFGIFHGRGDVRVRVGISREAVRYVSEKQMHASQRVELQPDGSAIVEFRLSNTTEVKAWILSFGSAAEALEPVELRREIQDELTKMRSRYRKNGFDGRAPGQPAKLPLPTNTAPGRASKGKTRTPK